MKAKYLPLLIPAVLLLVSTSLAQMWNTPQQVTTTTYDELNPTAVAYEDTVILFWDANIDNNRQLYYQVFDREGVAVDDTVMLTDDGANYAPNAMIYGDFPDHRVIVTWESEYDQMRDVAVTMLMNYQWQGVFMAFNTDYDEYGPDACYGEYDGDEYLVVVGQRAHAVLLKRWDIIGGHPYAVQVEQWQTFFDVSNVTCTSIDDGFALAWQEVSFTDTMCFYREYNFESGWGEEMEIDTGEIVAFNPVLCSEYPFGPYLPYVLFNHWVDGLAKVGKITRNYQTGIWQDLETDIFDTGDMNQFDPLLDQSTGGDFGIFASDMSGNWDIFDTSVQAFSGSDSDDLNPCLSIPRWQSWPGESGRFITFWETDRNGDWDIYMCTSEIFTPVEDQDGQSALPDKLALAVYPNPGNAQFRIDLELPLSAETTVSIFDISGRQIETLYSGFLTAGDKSFKWNGEKQPSGLYFVRVESEQQVQTNKLVLLK
ncbi:T9SS type A sorting domain-containing protein [bacterium]|nr:T9SS type A sorting domain-containing protein [bacterium]MBU1651425.1 T9SS type A sorting domain-containing protein [bacterium]MBU1881978.1 T9SS type A sorting domain-containing protein [bacterium]